MGKMLRPFKEWTTYPGHVGIDYPEPNDAIVRASSRGVVTFSGYASRRAGYAVAVNYGNGNIQWYKHSDVEDWRAPVGTLVELGDPIMEVGKLGEGSTGYHLHHEVFINGVIQTGLNYWRYIDMTANGYVGAPTSAGTETEDDDMGPHIAVVKGSWYLIQNVKGQPTGHLLGAASGAAKSGLPIIRYEDDWAVTQLKKTTVLK